VIVVIFAVMLNGKNVTSEKVREIRLRNWATRLGLSLHKSRARHWSINNHQRYMIVNPNLKKVFAGEHYDLSLDDVEEFLKDEEERMKSF
jgi:hypothetical protein